MNGRYTGRKLGFSVSAIGCAVLMLMAVPGGAIQALDATPTPVPAIQLPLDLTVSDTLPGNNRARDYQFDVPQNKDVLVTLNAPKLIYVESCHFERYTGPDNHGGGGGCGLGEGDDTERPTADFWYYPSAGSSDWHTSGTLSLTRNKPDSVPFTLRASTLSLQTVDASGSAVDTTSSAVPYRAFVFHAPEQSIVTAQVEDDQPNGGFLWVNSAFGDSDTARQDVQQRGVFYLEIRYSVPDTYHVLVGAKGKFTLHIMRNQPQALNSTPQQTTLYYRQPVSVWTWDTMPGQIALLDTRVMNGAKADLRIVHVRRDWNLRDGQTSYFGTAHERLLEKSNTDGQFYVFALIPSSFNRDSITFQLELHSPVLEF